MKSLNSIKYKLAKFFKLHQTFVVLVFLLIILSVSVFRVNSLISMPLDQPYLDLEVGKIKTVKFDEKAIDQIKSLRDSNVAAPGTNLPKDRQNPFNE